VNEVGYTTAEDAALGGFDRRFAKVITVRTSEGDCGIELNDDHVEIELATNEAPSEYTYFVHVERRDGSWFESNSHN